jgi:hypothetical protein
MVSHVDGAIKLPPGPFPKRIVTTQDAVKLYGYSNTTQPRVTPIRTESPAPYH